MHKPHAAMWRQRFLDKGVERLVDDPRPGPPLT